MEKEETLFSDHKGPARQPDETYEEYRERRKQEQEDLEFYRKIGRRQLKGDNIGSQRRRLMMKRMRRRGQPND